jgi:hypothetical protein
VSAEASRPPRGASDAHPRDRLTPGDGWRRTVPSSPAVARIGDNGCPPQGGLRVPSDRSYARRVGTGRGTRAQRGLTLAGVRRPRRQGRGRGASRPSDQARPTESRLHHGDAVLVDGPLDGVLPLPAGRMRRAAWMIAPVWHIGFAVLSVLGAVHAGRAGSIAPTTATLLYATAGALFTTVALVLVTLRVQGTRGGAVPLAPVQAAYLITPLASAVLLSAAYVTRLGGGPFLGGFGAMVALTVALVMLAQRTTELKLGSAGPVSERRTPTAPVVVPRAAGGAGAAAGAGAGAGAGAAAAAGAPAGRDLQ